MITLYDYLPSQNGYKVRQLLKHLDIPYNHIEVSIFEGEARTPTYLKKNPFGAVPVLELENGLCLSESAAILMYLAEGTPYLPDDYFERAKIIQWMSYEADYIQSTIGSLRYWMLTGQEKRVEIEGAGRRDAAERGLDGLERELSDREYLVGDQYSIADIVMFAYTSVAGDARFDLGNYPSISNWVERVRHQPDFLSEFYDYTYDPHAQGAL
jgi:glutathione S-transferase